MNYDGDKEISADDVFSIEHYQRPTFTFVDAIEAHKEAHHPTMLDAMHEPLNISIEMDMRGEREIKNVSDFRQLVKLAHPFDHGQQRKILFFAREEVNMALFSRKREDRGGRKRKRERGGGEKKIS